MRAGQKRHYGPSGTAMSSAEKTSIEPATWTSEIRTLSDIPVLFPWARGDLSIERPMLGILHPISWDTSE
jgi:hypothetical protein